MTSGRERGRGKEERGERLPVSNAHRGNEADGDGEIHLRVRHSGADQIGPGLTRSGELGPSLALCLGATMKSFRKFSRARVCREKPGVAVCTVAFGLTMYLFAAVIRLRGPLATSATSGKPPGLRCVFSLQTVEYYDCAILGVPIRRSLGGLSPPLNPHRGTTPTPTRPSSSFPPKRRTCFSDSMGYLELRPGTSDVRPVEAFQHHFKQASSQPPGAPIHDRSMHESSYAKGVCPRP